VVLSARAVDSAGRRFIRGSLASGSALCSTVRFAAAQRWLEGAWLTQVCRLESGRALYCLLDESSKSVDADACLGQAMAVCVDRFPPA
jgi:hypothetical protein